MQATETIWVPIAEAARQLGISIDTARRRVKRGELVAERRETAQGFSWWVCLAGAEVGSSATYADADLGSMPPMQDAQVGSTLRRQSEATHLAALVREFQAELMRRTEAAATWQARAEFLAVQLESARDEIKALTAPQTQQDTNPEPEPSAPTTEAPVPLTARLLPLAPWLLVVLAIGVVVVLLVVPR
jgi:hypothetical protein